MVEILAGYKGQNTDIISDRFLEALSYRTEKEVDTFVDENVFFACTGESCFEGDIKVGFNGRLNKEIDDSAKHIKDLYKKKGSGFLEQLNGSFRVSIYDSKKSELIIATDKIGSKNIFYSDIDEEFSFSSHMTVLLSNPELSCELNETTAKYFMISRTAALNQRTLIKDIQKMLAAKVLKLSENKLSTERYWDMYDVEKLNISDEELTDKIRSNLIDAVDKSIANADEINIFLSGDLDSNLITAMVKDQTEKPINTITFGRRPENFEDAKKVADHLDVNHKKVYLPEKEVTPSEVWKLEEPRIDGFLTFTNYFREEHNINEAFYGFFTETLFPDTYQKVRNLDRLKRFSPVLNIINNLNLDKILDRKLELRIRAGLNVINSTENSSIEIYTEKVPGIDASEWLPGKNGKELEKELCKEVDERWNLDNQSYYSNFEYLMMTEFLAPQRATCWNSIHAYAPYGHPELVMLGRKIPFEQKKNRKFQKLIAEDYLPESAIDKPSSGADWMVDEIIRPLFKKNMADYKNSIESLIERGLINEELARDELMKSNIDTLNRSLVICMLKMWILENWMKAYIDRNEPWKPVD
jgi:asparagine synthase (glutamine-hydrolysing)